MNGIVLLLAFAVLPMEGGPVRDHVDLIEVNHIYGPEGHPVFQQVIFYDWEGEDYVVVAWRGLKSADQWPQRNYAKGGFTTAWHDDGALRRVDADAVRETYTQYDVELEARETLPKELRRELRPAPKRKPFVREFPATQ
jgi:hypothetical protein